MQSRAFYYPAVPQELVRRASELRNRKSDLRGIESVAGEWLIIAASVWLAERRRTFGSYLLATAIIGARQRGLGNLAHEVAHRKLLASSRLNDRIGSALVCWPVLIRLKKYRRQHARHHRHLWDADRDPDVAFFEWAETETALLPPRKFFLRHVVLVAVPINPIRRFVVEHRSTGLFSAGAGLVAFVGLLASLKFSSRPARAVLKYWIVPWFTTYQSIRYWAELGEHAGLRDVHGRWGTRAWKGNWLSRWLIGSHNDDPYHRLHHLFPAVPHYHLRELDHVCRITWPEYAGAETCGGFFVSTAQGRSVMTDIRTRGGTK